MDLNTMVRQAIQRNLKQAGQRYICPAYPHYSDWALWDACFHAIICSELGLKNLAKNEIRLALKYQTENGWIPHSIFLRQKGLARMRGERFFFTQSAHSNYTQPPVLAQVLEWINDPEFTVEVFPQVLKFYKHLILWHDPDRDLLINNCHPFETGTDSDPTFDKLLHRRRFHGSFARPLDWLNYLYTIFRLDGYYRWVKWDLDKIWQSNLFNIEYPLFNVLWVDDLRSLKRLCLDPAKKRILKEVADATEQAIYEKMWDPEARIFRSLDHQNQKIKSVITASHLTPLLLDNIPTEMIQGLVEHLTDKREFWTPYPITYVPRNSPYFNTAESKSHCNWGGAVWPVINWLIIRALVKHGQKMPYLLDIAEMIAEPTIEMVAREGLWEYYHPLTGQGLRIKGLTSFSGLVVTFDKILK